MRKPVVSNFHTISKRISTGLGFHTAERITVWRNTERDRDRDRETERERQRQGERERDRERQRQREGQRERHIEREQV